MSSELDALGISWTDETTERAAVATRVAVDAAFAGSSEQKAVQSCARTLEKAEVALERYLGEMEEAQAEEKKSGTPAPPHVEGRRRQAIAKLQGEISTAMAQHKAARDKAARAKELLEMKQINAAVKARQEEDRRRLELEAARAEALAAGDDDDDDAVGGGAAGTRNVFAGQNSTATSVAAARHNLSRVEQIQREAQSTREEQLRRFQSGDRSAFRNANVGSGPGANASAASAARFGGSAAKVAAMHRETSAANRNLVGAKRPTKGTALAGADLRHVVGEATVGVDGTPMTEAAMEYRGGSRVHDSVFRTQVTTKDRRKFAKDRGEDDGDEAQFLARLKKEEDREIERAERRRVKERRRAKKNRLLEKKRQRDEEKAAAAAVAAVANAEAARAAGVDAGLDETGRQRKSKSKKEKKSMETKEEKKQSEKDEKKREKELKKAEKEQEKADKKAQRESEKQARKDQKEKEKQAKREAKEARHRASDAEPNASRGRLGEDQPLLAQSAASAASSATPVIGSASALGLQQEQTLLLNANSSNGRTTNNENSAVKISGCPSDGAMTEPLAVSAASSLPPTLAAPTFDGSAAGDGDSAADSDSDSDVMEVTADGSPIVSFKTEPGTSSSSSIPALITAASASGSSSSIVPPSATGSSASIGATAPTDNGVKKVRLVPTRKPPVAAAAAPSASTPPPAVAAPPAPSLVKLPSSTGPTGGAAGAAICPPSPLPPGKIVMKKMMMPLRTASQTAGSQTAASASASPVPPAVPRVASTSAVLPPFQVAAPLPPRPRPKPQAKLVGASASSAPGRSTRRRGRNDDDSDSDESSPDDDTSSSDDYDDSSSSDDGARRGKKKNAKKKAAEKAKKGAKGKKGKKGKKQESSSDSSWSSGSSSWDSALDELSDSQEEDEEAANGAGFFSDDDDQRRREVDDHLPEEMRPNFPVPILGSICLKKSVWDSLLDYQQVGLHWLCQHHLKQTGGILGDEMGLGKTIQIAAFLAALHQSGELTRPVLIVSPSTVLQQWVNELHKWCTGVRAVIWHSSGSAGQRGKDTVLGSVIETGGIVVTTYQTMALYVESLHEADFQYVILDEGHKICNPEANITIAAKTFTTPHRFILSGSPIQNSLKELWSLFDFVAPGIFGTLAVFTEEFEEPIRQSKNPTASAMQQNTAVQCARLLQRHIAPHLLRRMKKEVNTMLPAKHERVIRCPLTDAQLQEYLNILADPDLQQMFARIGKDKQEIGRLDRNGRNWRGALVSGPGEMRMAGRGITEGVRNRLYAYLTELRAVCNHADLHKLRKEDADEREALGGERAFGTEGNGAVKRKKTMSFRSNKDVFVQGSGKLVVLEKLMEQWHRGGHKVLLFSQTRMMLDILENFVEQKHYSYMRIDGTTPTKTRSILIDKYNADTSIFAALLTTRVGGIGVNLVGADRVVIFDPDWNPVTDEQARERAWRIGQSREVCIYRFITSGTVEEHVLHRQLAKTYVTDKVLADPTLERAFSQHSVTEAFMLGSEYASRVSSTSKEFVASSVTATLAQELDSAWAHAGHGHGAAKADAHKHDDTAQKQQPSKATPSAPLAASTSQAVSAQDSEAAAAAAAEAAAMKARVAAAVQRAVSSVGPQPPMPTPMAKTVGLAGHAPTAPPAAAGHVTRFGDTVASPGSAAVTSSTPRSPQMRAGSHGGGMGSRTPSGGAAELRTPGLRGVMSSQGGHTPKHEPTSPLNQAGTPGRRGSRPARITLPTAAGVHEAPEELVVDIAALTQDSPTERPPPSPRASASSSAAAAAAPTTGAAATSRASAPTQAAPSMPPPQVGFGASPFASNASAVGAAPPAASAASMPPPAVPLAAGSDGPRRQLSSLGGHRMSSFVRKDSAGADAAVESQLSDLSQVLEDEAKMDSGSFQGLGANGDDEDDMPRRKASDANKNGLTSVLQDLVDGEELQARPVDPLAFHLASLSAKRHLSNAIKSGQPAPHAAHHGHRHPGQAHASHSQGQQGQPQQPQQQQASAVRVKRERTR